MGFSERVGFEPTVPGLSTHAFQACTFGLSVISPGAGPRNTRGEPGVSRGRRRRREWDSNPRSQHTRLNGFRVRPIQPLSHLSVHDATTFQSTFPRGNGLRLHLRAQEDSNL